MQNKQSNQMASNRNAGFPKSVFVVGTLLGAAVVMKGCSRSGNVAPEAGIQSNGAKVVAAKPRTTAGAINGDVQPEVEDTTSHPVAVSHDHDVHDDDAESAGHTANHSHFKAEGALVSNHGIPLFQETQTSGGFTPQRRAAMVTDRLNDMAETHGLEAEHIFMRSVNGVPTVFFFHAHEKGQPGHVLATVDPKTAAQFGFGTQPGRLASWWRDVLRDHALIVSGESPLYTTPYTGSLQRFYELCQREHKGVPTHESFEQALARLSASERDALQSLYIRVPSNYRPQPDTAPPPENEPENDGGEHHHHD